MKKAVIAALLLTAAAAAPAHAAFTIDCKITSYGPGKEVPHPIQWKWDGAELRTTYGHDQPETIFQLAPMHFEQRDIDPDKRDSRGPKGTIYAFVMGVERNGDRMARTFMVMNLVSTISVVETAGFVSPAGAPISMREMTYRDCTWEKS